jgi:nucleotide-binding universal stress UspA family protein
VSAAFLTKDENTMKRFKNISLVYECDEPTLQRAATLAKDNRAKLTIVYPIRDLPSGSQQLTVGEKPIDIGKLVLEEYKTRLNEVAKSARSLGVRPATQLLLGNPSIEIIRDVIENRRDLVIMTAEGKGGLKQRLFGSTSTHLMRKCPAPLFIMKPGRRKRFHHILAAIDPEVTGDARDTLNGMILELAMSLSAREDANLHVVHAWTLFGESLLRGRGGMYAADVDRAVREEAGKRRRVVRSLLAKHTVTRCQLHLPKGDAAEVIPRLIGRLGIDVLVMGTVCRAGIPGFIIGNTAERVLDAVDCSVLVVKPEGFVSPVAPLISGEGGK